MPPHSPDARALIRGGSRTFHAASLMLPRRIREPARELYAFCRLADDAVDGGDDAGAAVAMLNARLDALYAGRPDPADARFAEVVERHAIPRALPAALIEGFAWDAQGRRYDTLHALHDYAARVAGAVGAMMALVMGTASREALARACDLGIAMQLSNVARDVGEDARRGRLYLPLDWMRAEGIDPEAFLRDPCHTPALARIVLRLLDDASRLYASARGGIAHLPADCRPGIGVASRLYEEIGREVARRGGNAIAGRAVVSPTRKTWAAAGSLASVAVARRSSGVAVSPAARFLVDAAARDALPLRSAAQAAAHVTSRLAWTLDLFMELERREEARRAGSGA